MEKVLHRRDLEPSDPAGDPDTEAHAERPSPLAEGRKPPKKLRIALLALVLFGMSSWLALSWVDRVGWHFFHTGEAVVLELADLADALAAGDFAAASEFYAQDFAGAPLGLNQLRLVDDRDGVRVYRFGAENAAGEAAAAELDRDGAVDEWRTYLARFDSVDEVSLYLHRLPEWSGDGEIGAVARYELIGTPSGELRAGIDRGYVGVRFRRTDEGPRLVATEPLDGDRIIAGEPHFVDVAAEAGVDFENRYYPRFLPENRGEKLAFGMLKYGPGGIAAVDYDGDGFQDLFVPDGVEARLFRNAGDGTFDDVTESSGLGGLDGVGVGVFADYDNDGDQDAFVSRTFEPNQIFRNEGDGTFTDVTEWAGIGADCCTTVASWGDVDLDGDLDLYVGRYLEPREEIPTTFYARNGQPNQLYRNDGEAGFTNVTESAGVGELGLCLGTVFGDYDDDGDADLYVVNDFGRKTLYRNELTEPGGDIRFTDVTADTGTLAYGAGMSASFGDYDNDLDLDIYVAHIRSEESWYAEWPTVLRYMANSWRQGVWITDMPLYLEIMGQSGFDFIQVFQDMASGNTLLRNRGDGTFEDVTWQTNANPPGWFWGSGFADFDNDGWQDIYSANGWVYNEPGTEIELNFLNSVVSEQKKYKSGDLFDPEKFGGKSWHGWERNRHLRSKGPGADGEVVFEEIGRAAGTDLLLNSRGTAVADFWNRGVLDLAVAASTDRHALLRNEVGGRRGWLAVELVGAAGDLPDGTNRNAVGARVQIRVGDQRQVREVVLGDGYGSQNTLRLHFGLGDLPESDGVQGAGVPAAGVPAAGVPAAGVPVIDELLIDELTVTWPRSGRVQTFTDVPANRIVEIAEAADGWVEKYYPTSDDATDNL